MSTPLQAVAVGATVERHINGAVFMRMVVTAVDDTLIHCGPWTFDRATGAEVDHELEWGPQYGQTGSFITLPQEAP